jgi:hypothetical protein
MPPEPGRATPRPQEFPPQRPTEVPADPQKNPSDPPPQPPAPPEPVASGVVHMADERARRALKTILEPDQGSRK